MCSSDLCGCVNRCGDNVDSCASEHVEGCESFDFFESVGEEHV